MLKKSQGRHEICDNVFVAWGDSLHELLSNWKRQFHQGQAELREEDVEVGTEMVRYAESFGIEV